MASRTYLVGAPVSVTVDDDGTVSACVYLEEAADIEVTGDEDEKISRDQMMADSASITVAFDTGQITVTSNVNNATS